ATPILSASFRASALNSAVCVLRIFIVDIIHLVKRLYSLSKVSKSVGTDHNAKYQIAIEKYNTTPATSAIEVISGPLAVAVLLPSLAVAVAQLYSPVRALGIV
ncbi:MAG: hypothetical protein KKE94_17250, partial [Gammaproteobacteria bacterium]|nr:hypothetical protein [Gammaproteobacteria bacterium]